MMVLVLDSGERIRVWDSKQSGGRAIYVLKYFQGQIWALDRGYVLLGRIADPHRMLFTSLETHPLCVQRWFDYSGDGGPVGDTIWLDENALHGEIEILTHDTNEDWD